MLLKLGEIQRRAPMASWEREKRPWGSQQALCRSCSLLPPPWAPAKCSWMAPLCSPHGRGQRGGVVCRPWCLQRGCQLLHTSLAPALPGWSPCSGLWQKTAEVGMFAATPGKRAERG